MPVPREFAELRAKKKVQRTTGEIANNYQFEGSRHGLEGSEMLRNAQVPLLFSPRPAC
jgi:hypothetical protein